MAKLSESEIRELGKQIILQNPGGIQRKKLIAEITTRHPELKFKSIEWAVWKMDQDFPEEISKPSRGIFAPAGTDIPRVDVPSSEADFYELFADWLEKDLEEVTVAVALGGAGLGAKWGTPDVVGVYRPSASNLIKFQPEIVSAEIKSSTQDPVVAFGQAAAYRLFSSQSYVVMPAKLGEEDKSRLDALCMLYGIGLVLFDLSMEAPNFTIRVRAQRFPPDLFYANEFADRLRKHDAEKFEKLFG